MKEETKKETCHMPTKDGEKQAITLTAKEIKTMSRFTGIHKHGSEDSLGRFRITTDIASGIGQSVEIECETCHKSKNVTDFRIW